MTLPLSGRTAIVTGAASGIGLATARLLAERGARVALADTDLPGAEAATAALGPQHMAGRADVSRPDEVAALVTAVAARFGGVSILVNNAGIGDGAVPTLAQSAERFEHTLSVHVTGSFLMAQAVAPHMMRQGGGAIVNLGSVAGLVGVPVRTAYSVAKAGIGMLTRVLACEWAAAGIRVNAVAPGYVRTALVEGLIAAGRVDAARIARRTPAGRFAAPEEIARVIAFLASDEASYVSGAVIPVDGGYTAFGGAFDASGEGRDPGSAFRPVSAETGTGADAAAVNGTQA